MRRTGGAGVLGRRALNRALLARQLLLRRAAMPALAAIEHLVGMQAQAPNPPYVGLWTRLDGFRLDDLSTLVRDRAVVRIALMRSTIHLVTARDCLALRPLLQPVHDRGLKTSYGGRLAGIDLRALAVAGRALVEERPRTFADLGARLAEHWPDREPAALAQGVRTLLPLVQVPPRGIWGASGPAAHTTAEAWLGRPLETGPSLDEMVVRYLTAFGPATVHDVQTWSGLTRLREVVDRLGPRLCTFRDEHGNELFDLPGAPRPDPGTPAPVRFVAEFDNLLLSHADRTRVLSDDHRRRLFSTANGVVPGTVLVDGYVRGTWKVIRERGNAVLVIEPYQRVSKKDTAALTREGARLLGSVAPDAGAHDVQFTTLD